MDANRILVVPNHFSTVMADRSAGHPRHDCSKKGVDGRDKRGHDVEGRCKTKRDHNAERMVQMQRNAL
jgi:hypothetical protein